MKKIIFLSLLLLPFFSKSQSADSTCTVANADTLVARYINPYSSYTDVKNMMFALAPSWLWWCDTNRASKAIASQYFADSLHALSIHTGSTAGGDLSGTYPNPTVAKIKGNTVPVNASGYLHNDGAGALTWGAISSTAANNQRIGCLINTAFPAGDSVNWKTTRTTSTVTYSAGKVEFSGNSGDFTNTKIQYDYNDSGTFFEKYEKRAIFINRVKSTHLYGFYIQEHSLVNANGDFDVTIDTIGKVHILSLGITAASTDTCTIRIGDSVQVSYRMYQGNIIASVTNLIKKNRWNGADSVPNVATVTYSWDGNHYPGCTQSMPVVGSYGGTQDVYQYQFINEEVQNPDYVVIGDSRVTGLFLSSIPMRWASNIGASVDHKMMVWAKGSATIESATSCFYELHKALNGQRAKIQIVLGINDFIAGKSVAYAESQLHRLVDSITSIHCVPILTKIAYVTTAYAGSATINSDVTTFNNDIGKWGEVIFDENTKTRTAGGALNVDYAAADGIHFNQDGGGIIAKYNNIQLAPYAQNALAPINILGGAFPWDSIASGIHTTRIALSPDSSGYGIIQSTLNINGGDIFIGRHKQVDVSDKYNSIGIGTTAVANAPLTISTTYNGTSTISYTNTSTGTSAITALNMGNNTGTMLNLNLLGGNNPGTSKYYTNNAISFYAHQGAIFSTATSYAIGLFNGGQANTNATLVCLSGNKVIVDSVDTRGSGAALQVHGDIACMNAGNGLRISTGTNATVGTATLTGGTVTVSTTKVAANSLIFVSHAGSSTTNAGVLSIGTITAGTSFIINSSNLLDNDTVNWWIINQP